MPLYAEHLHNLIKMGDSTPPFSFLPAPSLHQFIPEQNHEDYKEGASSKEQILLQLFVSHSKENTTNIFHIRDQKPKIFKHKTPT